MKLRQLARPAERVIWVVAIASIAEALLQAIEARIDGSWVKFWLWVGGGLLMGSLAAWAETVKVAAGE